MFDKTRKDKIRNEMIRRYLGVAPIDGKIGEMFNVVRSCVEETKYDPNQKKKNYIGKLVKRANGESRLLKTWIKAVRENILELGLRDDMWEDLLLVESESM